MDYSNYTISELRESLSSIDKDAYPENYQQLLNELASRKDEVDACEKEETEQSIIKTENRLKILSWLQIVTAVAFLYLGATSISSEQNVWLSLPPFVIAIFNAFAGYLLFRRKRLGFNLSYINQILQLFAFNLGFVYFGYSGLGTLMVVIQDGIALKATILNPAYSIYLGSDLGFGIGLDLVALFFLLVLRTCLEEVERWES